MTLDKEQYIDIVNSAMGSLIDQFNPIQIGQIIKSLMNAYDDKMDSKSKTDGKESPFNQYRTEYCAKCSKSDDGGRDISSDAIQKCAIVRMSLNGENQ